MGFNQKETPEIRHYSRGGMDRPECCHRIIIPHRHYRCSRTAHYRSIFCRVRYNMHPVLLSVSIAHDEKPLLRNLPDIQLGLHYDVHSAGIHRKLLCAQSICNRPAALHQMGDHLFQAS
jgi:hypothetical protein